MHGETSFQPDRPNCGKKFIPGYAPVLITTQARRRLYEFRERSFPVDLRIERAMVSAAVAVVLDAEALRERLDDAVSKAVTAELECPPPYRQGKIADHQPVLLRETLKARVRLYMRRAAGLSTDHLQLERLCITHAVNLVVDDDTVHEQWVQEISTTVSWEVTNTYAMQKTA